MKPYKIPKIKLSYISENNLEYEPVRQSNEIARIFRDFWAPDEIEFRESFKVAYLNRRGKVLGVQTISEGGTAECPIDAKLIYMGALLSNAHSLFISHNHPSGNLQPSLQDDVLTKEIKNGADTLKIKLLDHIILIKDGYYSYMDHGKMQ